jgi:hypothetical protein
MRWLMSFPITTRIITGLWIALTTLYGTNKAFHDYVFKIFHRMPIDAQEFIVGLVIPIAIAIGHWRKRQLAAT